MPIGMRLPQGAICNDEAYPEPSSLIAYAPSFWMMSSAPSALIA